MKNERSKIKLGKITSIRAQAETTAEAVHLALTRPLLDFQ